MTEHVVINDVAPRIQYVADGAQSAFSYPFAVFQAADLRVHLDEVLQSGGFTVSGAGASTGGAVVFAVPPAAGTRVTIRRFLALKRTTDFQADGIIRAKTLNDEFDYQAAALQQLSDDLGRTVCRSPVSASTAELVLPEPQAGCALKWNAAGTGLVNSTHDPDAPGDATAARTEAAAARDEAVAASALAQASVGGVRVSVDDGTAAPLSVKLAAGEGIALAVGGDPADQRLTIAATGSQAVLDRLAFLEANLALNTLRDQIDAGWSVLKMVDGVADEFEDESGVDGGSVLSTGGAAICDSSGDGTPGAAAAFDGNTAETSYWQSSSGAVNVAYIGYDFGSPKHPAQVAVVRNGYATGYFIGAVRVEASNDASNWTALGTATFTIGSTNETFTIPEYNGDYRYIRLLNQTAMSRMTVFDLEFRSQGSSSGQVYDAAGDCYHNPAGTDMTLASVATLAANFTTANPPTEVRLIALHQLVDAVTLNTDCAAEVSRDGGITWTAATLADEGAFDATTRILAGVADLSAQPAGTAMCWRFRTQNQKSQRLHGVWMQWR
jgi:hypothetical protein